jgi:glutamate formiminotransferase/formiminotetrahydrofolate cyclodeaminase
MENKLIECVPNFSEGRDMAIIEQITWAIESVDGVKLLDVDPGRDTNRTVVTFVGNPKSVTEAAFRGAKKAYELIDMSRHRGAHPRIGAMDVCPLIPVSGISMAETALYARLVAGRIGKELGIPVYCYEYAAFDEKRRNLANIRAGEYEGLKKKLSNPDWKPDFGPAVFNPKTGAAVVGARDFLVAYNVNLNTASTRLANAIAFDVRERGRDIINEKGEKINLPGSLKSVKAIGWYIEEYRQAQISMNLTNISITPVHVAFEEICRRADARGVRVTGSELVGMIPLKAMLDAGRYFLEKQHRSSGVPDSELISVAVKSLGLDDIHEFKPEEKIIEYVMAEKESKRLVDLNLRTFMEKISSDSPVPGGGTVSAYIGSLGTALSTMIANISCHKKGLEERWKEFSDLAVKGTEIQKNLLRLVDKDTEVYRKLIDAGKAEAITHEEIRAKNEAIQEATKDAVMVPYMVMEASLPVFDLIREIISKGNPNSLSDAGVAALAIRTAISSSLLNVIVNAKGLDDPDFAGEMIAKGEEIEEKAKSLEAEILKQVRDGIDSIPGFQP